MSRMTQVQRELRDDNEIFQAYLNCYNYQPNGLFLGTKSMISIAQSMGRRKELSSLPSENHIDQRV